MVFVYLILALAMALLGMSIKQLRKITEERFANLALRVKTLEEKPDKETAELKAQVKQMEKVIDDMGQTNSEVNDKFLKGIEGLFNYSLEDAKGAIKPDA